MGGMAFLARSTIVRLPLFGNGDYLSLIIVFIGTPLIGSLIVRPLGGNSFQQSVSMIHNFRRLKISEDISHVTQKKSYATNVLLLAYAKILTTC